MKKQLLLTRMLLLVALLVGSVSVWGDDQTLFDVTNSSDWETSNSTYSSTVWSSNGCIFEYAANNNKGFAYVRLGGKNLSNVNAYIATTTATTIQTKQLDVTVAQAYSNNGLTINSITLYVYDTYTSSTKTYSNLVENISYDVKDYTTGTMTFEPTSGYWNSGVYFKLVYNVSNSSTKKNYGTDVSKLVAKEYTGGTPTVVTPTFLPAGGTYNAAQSVSISCATDGATIHYTTDGSDPTESSASYSEPISVTTSGTTIKAKAFKADMDASAVASATYTIKPNKPTITITGNAISITGDGGCTFYYTTDGTAPTNSSTEYSSTFNLANDCTIKAIAYDTYSNPSDVVTQKYKYMPLSPKNINSNYYVKVTDASTLKNGDAVLIVCETDGQALGTTQNDNNRADANVTISEGVIQNPSVNVQKLTLVKKTETISEVDTDVFYFYTGSGYLYAASNSSNHLKTETTPDDNNNARAIISISSGDASVIFSGKNSHNDLRHNKTSNLFSCYESTSDMHDVQIYKEVVRPVTVTSAEYGTLYYENVALEVPTGAEAYTVKVADEKLVRSKTYNAGDVIAAGTAVVVKATANSYAFTASDVEGVGDDNNLLKGSDVAATTTGPDGCKFYKLSLDASNTAGTVGFYWGAADGAAFTSGAHKAYLVIPSGVTLTGKESFLFSDIESDSEELSEETTGIRSIEQTTENGVRYNLAGQKVGADYKGIVIVNGKKMLNK